MNAAALSEKWDVYLDVIRLHAHQLLVWAYQDLRSRIHAGLDEPAITGMMCKAMKSRLDYHPDTPDDYLHYTIGDQVPESPDGQLGNERLRLDISVIRSGSRPRLAYVFEAKRLRTSGFPIGEYVGKGGMGDFIECRYAMDSPEAVMVGFFLNKDVQYWHGELRRSFNKDSTSANPRLGIRSHPAPVEILPGLTGELESVHVRTNNSFIRLLHIFLDCS